MHEQTGLFPDTTPDEPRSPLRTTLDDEIAKAKSTGNRVTLKDLTVLASKNDPFRVDTAARHRDGRWLAESAQQLGLGERRIHLRGLHYMLIGHPKHDGTPYTNTDKDWAWLQEDAAKAARWLGYIPFEQIIDQRNAAPVVRLFEELDLQPYLDVDFHVSVPTAEDLLPKPWTTAFRPVQRYRIVFVGEKSSLDPVLSPIAERYEADLYLPTGEPSDTMLYRMARTSAEDKRPLVVLYFSDCDPAGWNMPISVARKLQAFRVIQFPDLDFEVHRVALTPSQVGEYGLPSTPLKDTELRADKWQAAMGVQQTEIDALAALRPDLLQQIAADAVRPFYDAGLKRRVEGADQDWTARAQQAIDEQIDDDVRDRIHADAARQLDAISDRLEQIRESMRLDASQFTLPPIVVPEAEPPEVQVPEPLVDSRKPFPEQCRRLIGSKQYASDTPAA